MPNSNLIYRKGKIGRKVCMQYSNNDSYNIILIT